MKVDPAAKELAFTSSTTCPDVTVSGQPVIDGFAISIVHPKMNGVSFPDSCVTVNVTLPQNYSFDPTFALNSKLMAASGNFDFGGLRIGRLNVSSMSGGTKVSNTVVSGSAVASTMSGTLDISVRPLEIIALLKLIFFSCTEHEGGRSA
jgi:hypothetical protein